MAFEGLRGITLTYSSDRYKGQESGKHSSQSAALVPCFDACAIPLLGTARPKQGMGAPQATVSFSTSSLEEQKEPIATGASLANKCMAVDPPALRGARKKPIFISLS